MDTNDMENFDDFFLEESGEDVDTDVYGGDPVADEPDTDTDPEGDEGTDDGGDDGADDGGQMDGGLSPEMQAAIEAETQKRVDAAIAKQFEGMKNPYTGKEITTEAELEAYKAAYAADMRNQQLQDMGVDKEMLDKLIQESPAMQQANQIIRQHEQQQANAFMSREFEAMKREFPECGFENPEQMHKTEAGKKALQMWANTPGVTLADAYAATHRAEISKKQSAAAKQAAMNQMNSKNHLTKTKGGGAAKVEVPADVMEEYKRFFPGASAAEITEMYRKNKANE